MKANKYAACFKKFEQIGVTEMKCRDWQKMNMENLKDLYHYGHQRPK